MLGSIDNLCSFGVIDTVLVRGQAHDRTVLLVQLKVDLLVFATPDSLEEPEPSEFG